jgi:hypothetical protein
LILHAHYAARQALTKPRIRQYKNKISSWGLGQHHKANDLKWIAAKQQERKREAGLETVFIVRNTQLELDRLEHFKKRANDKASPSARESSKISSKVPAELLTHLQLHPRGSSTTHRMLGKALHQEATTVRLVGAR